MESQSPRKKGIDWTNPPRPYEPPPAPPRLRRPLLLTGIAGAVVAGVALAAILSFNGTIGNGMTEADSVVVAEAEAAPPKKEATATEKTAGRLASAPDTSEAATLSPPAGSDPRWGKDSPAPDAEDVAAVTAHAEASGAEHAYAERQRSAGSNFDRRSTASIDEADSTSDVDVAIAETEEEVQALEAIEGEAEAEASEVMPEPPQPAAIEPERQPATDEQPQAEEPKTVTEEEAAQQVAALPSAARPSDPLVPATTTDGVNLRSGPNNRSSVVAVLVADLPVQASQNCPSWCEVVVNGRRGYVYKNYIRYSQNGAQATPASAQTAQQAQAAPGEARQPAAETRQPVGDQLQRTRSMR